MSGRRYRYLDAAIEIRSDRPSTADWLDEMLVPWLEPTDEAVAGFSLRVGSSSSRFLELVGRFSDAASARAPWFSLDRERVELPTVIDDDRTIGFDENFGCVYVQRGSEIEVIGDDTDRHRIGALRVARELVVSRARSKHARSDVHASAAEVDGRALVMTGAKESGKTTLLTAMLAWTGARWISNDRLLAWRDGEITRVRGVPTVVSVRAPTLLRFPSLASQIPRCKTTSQLTLAESEAAVAVDGCAGLEGRLRMSGAMFSRQLASAPVAERPLLATLLLELDPNLRGFELHALGREAAEDRLLASAHGQSRGTSCRRTLLSGPEASPRAEAHPLANAPVLECRMGPDVPTAANLRALLAAIEVQMESAGSERSASVAKQTS